VADALRFTITNGQATAVFKVKSDGRTERDKIEAKETYTYAMVEGVDTVTRRETNAGYVEEKVYQDDNGDGKADFVIELSGVKALTAGDLIL